MILHIEEVRQVRGSEGVEPELPDTSSALSRYYEPRQLTSLMSFTTSSLVLSVADSPSIFFLYASYSACKCISARSTCYKEELTLAASSLICSILLAFLP